MTGSEVTHYH